MTTVTTQIFELGRGMRLQPVTDFYGRSMKRGDVIEWRGAYSARYVITEKIDNGHGMHFRCIKIESLHFHQVEAHNIKRVDDETLWHTQHYFKVSEIEEAKLVEIEAKANAKADDDQRKAESAKRAKAEQIARGQEVHARLFPWARSFIVAERIVDDSDLQSDYFAEHGEDMIILAPSKSERNNFSEMRKDAMLIPETKHLGPGKDKYFPCVVITEDNPTKRMWKGCRSEWHRHLADDETGNIISFSTVQELTDWTSKQPAPYDVEGMKFAWSFTEEKAEHREDYAGGKGLYLQLRGNSWRVYKETRLSDDILLALGSDRISHLQK